MDPRKRAPSPARSSAGLEGAEVEAGAGGASSKSKSIRLTCWAAAFDVDVDLPVAGVVNLIGRGRSGLQTEE